MAALLLPGVVFYEAAAASVLGERGGRSVLTSRDLINTLFEIFGVIGVHLPGILLAATLLAQQLISRPGWRLRPIVPLLMLCESVVWALPIAVLAGVMGFLSDIAQPGPTFAASAIAVGAGVYEEFVFRFALIAAVHALLVDVCSVKEAVGRWLSVGVSAFAFASFHGIEAGGGIDVEATLFYLIAGVFLAWLFLTRGLGIAAGAHAVYDLIILVVLPAVSPG
ncbi:MAG: CPBP family intramembrane glutamic endopeptidase [Planctomycetota bacterium]